MKKLLFLVFILSSLFAGAQSSLNKGEEVDALSFSGGVSIVDSSTDWMPFIQNAINYLNTRNGGIIKLPSGNLYVSGTIYDTITAGGRNTNIIIRGQGGPLTTHVITSSSIGAHWGPTYIFKTTATDTLFYVSGTSTLSFQDCAIGYSGASTTNTNTGIYYYNGNNIRLQNFGAFNFGTNVDIVNGANWLMQGCFFVDPHVYNLKLRDSLLPDYGDNIINNCWFLTNSARGTGCTHIKLISGGGLKVIGSKFNAGLTGGGSFYPLNCIDAPFLGTVDMIVSNNSFENFTGYAFKLVASLAPGTGNIHFINNQVNRLGAGGYSGPLVLFDGTTTSLASFRIAGNLFGGAGGLDTAIYIKGANISNGAVTDNRFSGYTSGNEVVTSSLALTNKVSISSPQFIQQLTEVSNKITWNPMLGQYGTVTLTGNDTLVVINPQFGQPFHLVVSQNATGGWHLIVTSGNYTQNSSATVTLNAAANAVTILDGYINGLGYAFITNIQRGFDANSIPYFSGGIKSDPNFGYNGTTMFVGSTNNVFAGQAEFSTSASDFAPQMAATRSIGSALGSSILLGKSRGTKASPTVMSANDYLGQIWFAGHDGTGYKYSGSIGSYADSAISSNSVPTAFFISTNYTTNVDPRGSSTRFNIDHLGRIGMQSGTLVGDTAHVTIGGDFSSFNNGTAGAFLSVRPAKYTMWNGSGTIAHVAANSIGKPQFASNGTATITDATTFYIDAAPVTGNNVAITNSHSLYVNSGNTFLGGGLTLQTIPSGTGTALVHAADSSVQQMSLSSGTYTPTITNGTNIAGSTTATCYWHRIGNIVSVSGSILFSLTSASVASQVDFSLPVASNFTGSGDAAGLMAGGNMLGTVPIAASAANDRITVLFTGSSTTTSQTNSFNFSYIVQ